MEKREDPRHWLLMRIHTLTCNGGSCGAAAVWPSSSPPLPFLPFLRPIQSTYTTTIGGVQTSTQSPPLSISRLAPKDKHAPYITSDKAACVLVRANGGKKQKKNCKPPPTHRFFRQRTDATHHTPKHRRRRVYLRRDPATDGPLLFCWALRPLHMGVSGYGPWPF